MEDNRRSFKRRSNSFSDLVGGNKRGKYGDQLSENSQASETVYRILCHSRKIGSVIGKGGGIVQGLREETQARITVADAVPGSEERVILVYSFSAKNPVTQGTDMELQCAAQDALLKVHDRIVGEDVVSGTGNETVVTARLLVPNNAVGCLLGKNGDVIKRLRSQTRASIRVLPADQLPVCAMSTDELVQISAKPAIAKRALYEVSTLLHQNPHKDKPPSGFPIHPPMSYLPPPLNPMWLERGSSARGGRRKEFEHSRFGPADFDGVRVVSHGGEAPAEFSMKILCPAAKIGGVIGKGGSNVRKVQQETGTDIHVDDVSGDSDERVIHVSAIEAPRNPRSQTIDAILLLQDKMSNVSDKGTITTRLLIPSSKVGCIIGQGGQIINEMRSRTKADIRVYSKEEKPKCAGQGEELVQVSGGYGAAKDAIGEIASRYRERCLGEAKSGLEPASPFPSRGNLPTERPSISAFARGGLSGGYEPFQDCGREYEHPSYPAPRRDFEPYSRSGPLRDYESYCHSGLSRDYEPYVPSSSPRDYEPYSHPGPSREYEPHSLLAPPRDNEPHGYQAPPRVYESHNSYLAPPMNYEPCGYASPSRDFEGQGYRVPPNTIGFSGAVDMKMRAGAGGSAVGPGVGNASEITGTRPKLQYQYAGGSESFGESRGTYQGYGGQKRTLQSTYHDSYNPQQEPYDDTNPSHSPYNTNLQKHLMPYLHYQDNPPQQGHYSDSPYQY